MKTKRRIGLHRAPRERGASAVMALLCLLILLGMFALSAESGLIYSARGEAQTAADSAALAAVRALNKCDAQAADRDAALAAAVASMAQNKVAQRTLALDAADVVFGRYYPYGNGAERNFVVTNTNPNSVQVQVHMDATRNGPLELSIGKLLGRNTVNVGAGAIASRDRRVTGFHVPPGSGGRIIPFAGKKSAIGPVGSTVSFYDASTGNGNWGMLDLVAPSGLVANGNNGMNTIKDQISDGYEGDISADPSGTQASGRPGDAASIGPALTSRIGEIVMIAVYEGTPTASGTNLIYNVTGFVPIRIDRVVTTGNPNGRGVFGTVVESPDSTATTDPNAAENCLISKIVIAK